MLDCVVVDRVGLAGIPAAQAFRTDAARQTPSCLRLCQLVRVSGLDLNEARDALLHWPLGHRDPVPERHFPSGDSFADLRASQVDDRQLGLQRGFQLLAPQVAVD